MLRIAAIATLAFLPTPGLADVPLWQAIKGEFSDHRLFVDPRIAADARFAPLLKTRLDNARDEVRSSDEWARDAIKENSASAPRPESDERLELLGNNGRYAAILRSDAQCVFSCSSAEMIALYRLADHKLLKPNDVLDLASRGPWLTKLASRDRDISIGPQAINCAQTQGSEDCLPLSDVLAAYGFGDEPGIDVKSLADKTSLGFSTDDGGKVRSLDLYISRQREVATHSQVYKWPLSVEDVTPLLRPEMRELAANTKPTSTPPADPKPDAVVKNKNIEARVFLDDKIKADAPLAADCLAEGKKWLDKNAADAAASRKEDPQFFKDGGWDFERKYSIRSVVTDRYVSLLRDDYMDTHGAHPNSDVNTILWDKSENKRISIRPFFTETADNGATMKAMVKAVIASLKIEKKKRDSSETSTNEWFKSVEPSLLKIGAVTLAPSTEADKSSGLTFHYPPYAVGPYAEGQYVAFVPWETLKPYLTPEGARIFGGARPKGDAEDQQ